MEERLGVALFERTTRRLKITPAGECLLRETAGIPVILEAADYARWLDPALAQSKAVLDLMVPAANEVLQVWPVSRRVNRPVEDDAALVTPVMTGTDAFTLE